MLGAVLTFVVWKGESAVTRVAGLWWGLVTGITATSLIGTVYLSQTDWQAEAGSAHERSKATHADADAAGNEHKVVLTTDEGAMEGAKLTELSTPESAL